MHMSLMKNARTYKRMADFGYNLTLILSVLGALFSITTADKRWLRWLLASLPGSTGSYVEDEEDVDNGLFLLLLVIPLLTGAMGALIARTRYNHKWGMCLTGASQIEGEIYKFRCRVLEYDPSTRQKLADQDGYGAGGGAMYGNISMGGSFGNAQSNANKGFVE